jgi:presenilin 1
VETRLALQESEEFVDPHDYAGVFRNDLANLAAVVRPVAVCMVLASLAVAFVRDQAFDAALSSGLSTYLVFNQDASSAAGKGDGTLFGEGLLNALVIVCVIAAATFMMACCIYLRLTFLLAGYIMFAMTMLLGYTGGFMVYTSLTVYHVPMSFPTMIILLWNFAIVGVISIFYQKGIPRAFTQWYLIAVSCIMAWTLSKFPQWTSWALLIMLALYDLCAVLTPCGPLRCIINLVQTRDVNMSGLVYEADVEDGAPAAQASRHLPEHLRDNSQQRDTLVTERGTVGSERAPARRSAAGATRSSVSSSGHVSAAIVPDSGPEASSPGEAIAGPASAPASALASAPASDPAGTAAVPGDIKDDEERARKSLREAATGGRAVSGGEAAESGGDGDGDGTLDVMGEAMSSSIKLGLGDFVFYSVLVSRAALAGMTTFAACFVAIICGLAGTIALLAVIQRALPALPISIFFGVIIFFIVRLTVIPLVIVLSANGVAV